MTVGELGRLLYDLGVPPHAYRLDGSHFELANVLRHDGDRWIVFLSERGGESDRVEFQDEHHACVHLLGRVCLTLAGQKRLEARSKPASRARLEWTGGDAVEIGSREELDRVVDRLHAEAEDEPFIVELVIDGGGILSVGLGRSETVLSYMGATLDPPYFQTAGGAGDRPVTFRYRGDWSEFPPDSAVPLEQGRAALREFFSTGRRPDSLVWREV